MRPKKRHARKLQSRISTDPPGVKLYKLHEAAVVLGCAYNTIRKMILRGDLLVIRAPNNPVTPLRGARIAVSEIERYIATSQVRFSRPA